MPKTKISEFSSTPANNTDIDSINIAEGCAPSGINDAIRELMAQLKDWQSGTSNDPYVVGSSGSLTLNQGTANGVAYLNGSKVVTSGSALSFDGSNLGINSSVTALTNYRGAEFAGTSITTGGFLRMRSSDSSINSLDFTDSNGRAIFTTTSHPVRFGTNDTERMRLDASGNLGVGTTSPSSYAKTAIVSTGTSTTTALLNGSGASASNTVSTDYWSGNSFGGLEKIATIGAINPNAGSNNGGAIYFSTSSNGTATTPTERARIDSSGNFLVNTTTSTHSGISSKCILKSVDNVLGLVTDSGSTQAVRFTNGTTAVGSINLTTSTTAYSTTSDYRLKTVIGSVTGHGERIDALEPIEYEWKTDGSRTRGFLAHKFQEVYAGSVTGTKDAVDEQGNPVYQAMQASSSEVIADLVAEIKALRQRVAQLEAQ